MHRSESLLGTPSPPRFPSAPIHPIDPELFKQTASHQHSITSSPAAHQPYGVRWHPWRLRLWGRCSVYTLAAKHISWSRSHKVKTQYTAKCCATSDDCNCLTLNSLIHSATPPLPQTKDRRQTGNSQPATHHITHTHINIHQSHTKIAWHWIGLGLRICY